MTLIEWMRDDITWCGCECDNLECFRNLKNRKANGLFSMSLLRDTDLCPLNKEKDEHAES